MSETSAINIIEECVTISGPADVARLEQRSRELARCLGFSTRSQWQVAVAVTEAALGLLASGKGGVVKIRCLMGDRCCLELEALDHGAGKELNTCAAPAAMGRMMDEICLTGGVSGASLVARKFLDLMKTAA